MGNYLKSNQVLSVYPTAYRNAIFDNQADNNTEFNITNIADRIGKRNYVIQYNNNATGSDVALSFSIGGYIFQISATGFNAIKNQYTAASGKKIYAYIRTATDTTFKNTELVEADGSSLTVATLDTGNTSDSDFHGLAYSDEVPTGKEYVVLLEANSTGDNWIIPTTSYVILDSTQIGNCSDEPANQTLSQKVTTEALEVNGEASFSGDITQSGTSKFNGVRVDSQTTGFKLSGGTTSKYFDNQANTLIKADTTINKALTVGADSTYTGGVEIKGRQKLDIIGDKINSGTQILTFSGTSQFQAGDYSSSSTTTSGYTVDKIKVGGNEFDVVTRGTNQQISGDKISTGLISSPNFAGNIGTCSTSAANSPKNVSLSNFKLTNGCHIFVKFDETNTKDLPSMNVNSTGNKPMLRCWGQGDTSEDLDKIWVGQTLSTAWDAGQVVEFVYSATAGVKQSGSIYSGAWIRVGYQETVSKVAVTPTANKIYLVGSRNNTNSTHHADTLYEDLSIAAKEGNLYIPDGGNIIINEYVDSGTTKYKTKLFSDGKIDTQSVTVGYTAGTSSTAHTGSKLTTSLETQSITLPSNLVASGTSSSADMYGTAKRSVADGYGNTIYTTYLAQMALSGNTITLKDKGGNTNKPSVSLVVCSGKNNASTPADITSSGSVSSSTMTLTLGNSGITAGSYGDDQTTQKEPGYGGTFKVPFIKVNEKGIIIKVSEHNVKIPASDNTNTVTNITDCSTQGYVAWTKDGVTQTEKKVGGLQTNSSPTFNAVTVSSYFNISSDERLKENIKPYKCEKSILDLDVKEFDYKKTGHHDIGFIAQDLQKVCPEIVREDNDGYLTIEESKLVYLLLQEVKELKKKIEELGGK